MASKYNWVPLNRAVAAFAQQSQPTDFEHVPLAAHPLVPQQPVAVQTPQSPQQPKEQQIQQQRPEFDDPLSMASDDPLSAATPASPMSATGSNSTSALPSSPQQQKKPILENDGAKKQMQLTAQLNRTTFLHFNSLLNWNNKKAGYLKRYTTDKNIPVISKIVDDHSNPSGDEEDGANAAKQQVITLEDRLKMRLEQLEEDKRDEQGANVEYKTQKEYIKHLESLDQELNDTFDKDRVHAFKIVVRCCKILGRNQVPAFYPSMFVLVSEVLDSFGRQVFKRIRSLSVTKDYLGRTIKLPAKFSASDVSADAKEVCQNWFNKIASIRELDARFYCEMALLGCKRFFTDDHAVILESIERLARATRGLGDPLVAAFARLYLARKGLELVPGEKKYLMMMLDDIFFTIDRQCQGEGFERMLEKHKLTRNEYLELFEPPLEWLYEMICSIESTDAGLMTALRENYERRVKHPMVLKSIITGFDADVVSRAGTVLVYYIKTTEDDQWSTNVSKSKLYRTLGEKFVICAPPRADRLKLLNEVWKDATLISNIQDYVQLVEIYIEYVCKNFSLREISILLKDLHRHMQDVTTEEAEKIQEELRNILMTVLEYAEDFVKVFNLEQFLPLFDRLNSAHQIEVSKGMLAAFSRRDKSASADPVLVNSMFDLAKTVHDSINDMSSETEKREIGMLLSKFISKINFGMAYEKQLQFYVEIRRAFSGFDIVKEALVMAVLSMVQSTYTIVKGKHNKKTYNFVKACLAFCHITIPSIDDLFSRLHLYVLAGQIAIVNSMLSQADVLFKIAIETVAEVPELIVLPSGVTIRTERDLVSYVRYLLSAMVAVPGHPEFGPFYLLKGLVKAVIDYKWPSGSTAKVELLTDMLSCVASFAQPQLPYHYIGGQASNDELFFGDSTYVEDIVAIGSSIVEESLRFMTELAQDEDVSTSRKLSLAALDLFNSVVYLSRPGPQLLTLAYNLFNLAKKNVDKDSSIKTPLRACLGLLDRRAKAAKANGLDDEKNPYMQLHSKLALV